MVPRRHGAIGCATNDPGTTPRSWRACERWRKPVRQPPVIRGRRLPYQAPSYWPRMASPLARPGLS
jgi:hypothetical protein